MVLESNTMRGPSRSWRKVRWKSWHRRAENVSGKWDVPGKSCNFLVVSKGFSVAKLETWKFFFETLSLSLFHSISVFIWENPYLKLTAIEATENWWIGRGSVFRSGFLFWGAFRPILRGCLTVSFREGRSKKASCFLFCVPTNFSSSTRIGHPCFREL